MKKEQYINELLDHLRVSRKVKNKIKEDITNRIEDALNEDPFYDIVKEMGSPKELASEFMENLEVEGKVTQPLFSND